MRLRLGLRRRIDVRVSCRAHPCRHSPGCACCRRGGTKSRPSCCGSTAKAAAWGLHRGKCHGSAFIRLGVGKAWIVAIVATAAGNISSGIAAAAGIGFKWLPLLLARSRHH